MVFEQHELKDVILTHFGNTFQGKRVPIHPHEPIPDQLHLSLQEHEQILDQEAAPARGDKFDSMICSPYTLTVRLHPTKTSYK